MGSTILTIKRSTIKCIFTLVYNYASDNFDIIRYRFHPCITNTLLKTRLEEVWQKKTKNKCSETKSQFFKRHLVLMILRTMEEFEMTPFAFVRKICSISGIWPLLTPCQRRIRAFFISVVLFITYAFQVNINSTKIKSHILFFFHFFFAFLISEIMKLPMKTQILNLLSNEFNTKSSSFYIPYLFSTTCICIVYYSLFHEKKLVRS